MKKLKKSTLALATATGVLLIALSPAVAFEGENKMGMWDHGPRDLAPENRLITPELHEQFREQYDSLSEEQQRQLREERITRREEKRAEMEAFVGLTREEMREARKSGQSMSEILASQGKTEADAEVFLTEQANERIQMMADHHDLTTEETATLQERVTNFVQKMLARWFNK
ncbi:MAG: hypothetical protein COU67_02670 [Candidatus Pacebacteria bacterium CG10_big_fil_rev_8_21_14_0_10_44_54]|nr:hypothetical protein [bacterium]PIR60295.1 MAG: hypothetical protein COU67_02670 [Candidatus Pacebacteria bacterium CG10_big_fil_rev_8_21_14_0_10_44_54]